MPRRVYRAVLLAFLCHGLFILTARYRLSYDAYTHMLFADHYAADWFSLWETRWYTGFTVVSYPPLVHQLIALFVPLLGFDKAFALVLWIVASCYPLGVYAFARIFTGRSAASHAALVAAILMPIYVTAYIFGQLPFLASTLIALLAAASLDQYLHDGGWHNFLLSVFLIATSMATHHATLIVQPFLVLAVAIKNLALDQNADRLRALWLIVRRLLLFGASAVILALLVIWPFWQWGRGQTIQTPIDHLSRHNFFLDPRGFAVFFFPLYGPLVFLLPFLIRRWSPHFIGLLISFVVLFLLGLGGTTPLPRLIFGDAWEWLTFDRFAFWASLCLTPFFGMLFISLRWKNRSMPRPVTGPVRRNISPAVIGSAFAITALGVWLWPVLFPTQPDSLDMTPVVNFLDQDDRSQWRYLTFGFGNQYTHLNLLTTATTMDGSYHTVRTLPELRASGVAEVDTAYWSSLGISAIIPILEKSSGHGVRWGFVNRKDFIPTLKEVGWIYRETLSNGVQVWENPYALLPPPSAPPRSSPIESFSWGTFPLLALVTASALGALKVRPLESARVLKSAHAFLVGLIPISLCFWYFRTVLEYPHARVYFIYTSVLFFVSDALVVLAVIFWACTKVLPVRAQSARMLDASHLLLALLVLCTLSAFWSLDWRISLFLAFHFWLVFLLTLSLREWPASWKFVMLGSCAALSMELITGFVGVGLQSTAFLDVLNTEWPGILDPSIRGASVVQLADGLRILRAYGTVPHPNILGGFVLFSLLGPASLFLFGKKTNYPALFLVCLGVVLIVLTFSRSAWLGLIAFLAVLVLKSKSLDRARLFLLVAVSLVTLIVALIPVRELVFTRVGNSNVPTEQLSAFGREWLNAQAFSMFHDHPFTGVGLGSFILKLSTYAVEGALIEPVHGIPLLMAAELGIAGFALFATMMIRIGYSVARAKTARSVVAGAMLIGLGVIGLFDHYLWSLAPGRVMLGLALGLWMGATGHDA